MESTYKSKKSAWGAISIWKILLFGIIIPAILVVGACVFKGQADASTESSSFIESSSVIEESMSSEEDAAIVGSESIEESASVEDSESVEDSAVVEDSASVEESESAEDSAVIGGIISAEDNTSMDGSASVEETPAESSASFMQKMAPFAGIILLVSIVLAIISLIITVIWTIVVIYRAKQYSYEFCGNTLIVKEGAVFSGATENRRMHFFPGMNISVKQTFKGKIFNYGDVVVSMGIGQAGQIVMDGIKNPKEAGRVLSKYAAEVSNARANNRVSIFMPGVTGYPFFF